MRGWLEARTPSERLATPSSAACGRLSVRFEVCAFYFAKGDAEGASGAILLTASDSHAAPRGAPDPTDRRGCEVLCGVARCVTNSANAGLSEVIKCD